MHTKERLLFFTIFFLLLAPVSASAQLILPIVNSPVSFVLTPNNPGPNERVTIRIDSHSVDLDRATIDWFLDGGLLERGDGLKTIRIETGDLGSETNVSVLVRPDEVTEIFDQITIRPTSISVLWEADTYTPPFYRGRALATTHSDVLVEAYPHAKNQSGNDIPAGDFVFTWRKNGGIIEEISGRGRSTARIPGPLLFGEDIISVEAVSVDNRHKAVETIRIPAVEPHISLHREDPLLGIMYHNALTSSDSIPIADVLLAAVPFYMSTKSPYDSEISYVWNINGQTVATDPRNPFRIILRLSGGMVGTANISLSVSHIEHFLQSVEKTWNLAVSADVVDTQNDPFFRNIN